MRETIEYTGTKLKLIPDKTGECEACYFADQESSGCLFPAGHKFSRTCHEGGVWKAKNANIRNR